MILSKSRIYETRIFKPELKDKKFRKEFIKHRRKFYVNDGLYWSTKLNNKKMISYFLQKGNNRWNKVGKWNWGLCSAAQGGYPELIDVFILKNQDWNYALKGAVEGGHEKLVHFFISKGSIWNYWGNNYAIKHAKKGGNTRLIKFFVKN